MMSSFDSGRVRRIVAAMVPLAPVLLFAIAALFVDPRGEFPLNDDWSFALSTWRSMETGRFELAMFSGMALKTQIIWGAIWSAAFGKSFVVLRLSVLALAFATIVIFALWVRRCGLTSRQAVATTLALLIHPVFFWCAFTYMTHVPFVFLSMLSVVLLSSGLIHERTGRLIGACVAIVAACLLRQTGIGLAAAAFLTVILLRRELAGWRRYAAAIAAVMVLFFVLFTATDLLSGNLEQTRVHTGQWRGDPTALLLKAAVGAVTMPARAAMNFWLFALPLTLPFAWRATSPKRLTLICSLVALPFTLAPASYLVGTRSALPTPTRGDILENLGLGPRLLPDVWLFGLPSPLSIDYPARVVLTYVVAVGTGVFLGRLTAVLISRGAELDRAGRILVATLVLSTVMMSLALVPGAIYFDRHSLDAMWFLIPLTALLFPWKDRRATVLLGAGLIVFAFLVVGATQEYLNWNRARWDAYASLRARGIGLERISGGYEINQYLLGGFHGSEGDALVDDEFILAFSPVPGYVVEQRFPYSGYFGLYRGHVHVERRVTPWRVR